MPKSGNIIAVVGRSGCGKTTMAKIATENIENIEYLPTYTTRKPRNGDFGYIYTTENIYLEHMSKINEWDHFELNGNFYGTNVFNIRKSLLKGKSFIFASYPDIQMLKNMEAIYKTKIISIYVDTPEHKSIQIILNERPSAENKRIQQENSLNLESLKLNFDHIFKPTMEIKHDMKEFINLVKNILYV
jgi:guanylate kinase